MRLSVRRLLVPLTALALLGLGHAMPSGAAPSPASAPSTIVALNANQSSNWSGYNQGTLEQGGTQFHQVSAYWNVPIATQHKRGRSEYSSAWIGIGGGCVDAGCAVGDNTLIQTGTEQDVTGGKHGSTATYSAWWEIIPGPSITIDNLKVHAGDTMYADIREIVPFSNVWTITLRNVTTGVTFTQTVPYTSTHATAEWIVETPLLLGTDGVALAAMPNLSRVQFSNAKTNDGMAGLKPSEEIQLVDNNQVIATPSAPSSTHDGFNDCTYTTSCPAP